jgi:hypothetical protein
MAKMYPITSFVSALQKLHEKKPMRCFMGLRYTNCALLSDECGLGAHGLTPLGLGHEGADQVVYTGAAHVVVALARKHVVTLIKIRDKSGR